MKKYLNVFSVIALIAGLTVLASCSNPTEPRGFRGQISGIVYDTVTAQPIPDVVVRIAGSTKEVKTSENGDYLFQDIEPGTYTISFSKEGYQFRTKNVFVDPEQYKLDDPFAEYEAFIEKIKAGDEKVPNKLKYDYTTVLPLYLTGLAPLNGTLKGSIKLFTTPESDLLTQSIDEATDIIDGVEIWFKDTSFIIGYDDQGNQIPQHEDTIYGPVLTKDGTFEMTGLPVGEDLVLVISSFFLDDGSYFTGKPIYAFDYGAIGGSNTGFTDLSGTYVVAENNVEDALTNVGTFYLFTEGKFAVVTANSTGSPAGPVSPTGSITLTFSEPINDATFKAVLDAIAHPPLPSNAVRPATIELAAAWDADKTTVTLTPATLGNGYLRIAFPYSINAANPVGFLTLEGKAASGAEIYAEGIGALKGIPVFTEEGINLVSIDTTTAGSARKIAVARTRIRLTFSKDINLATASFGWGTSPNVKDAEFFAVSGDTKSVDVSTELLFSSAVKLAFTVTALADPNDSVSDTDYSSLDTFERAPAVQKLTLTSTNLYTNKDGAEIDAGGTNANFNYTNNITLTFDRTLPTGATARVAIAKQTPAPTAATIFEATPGFITLTPSISGSTLTIAPTDPLLPGTEYYLAVEIAQGNNVLFDSGVIAYYSSATGADKVIAVGTISTSFSVIAFKTAKEEVLLKKTNLWDNRIDWTPPAVASTNANFPVDSTTIVLTFDKPITAYDVGVFLTTGTYTAMPAHIPDSLKLTNDPTISGSILTIPLKTGVLQYDTPYTLIVEVNKDGKNILDLTDYSTEYAEFVALDSSGNITFYTEDSELLLSSTTIYDAYAVPADEFPPTAKRGDWANFPTNGTISLTFNKAIPADAKIQTALGRQSAGLDYGTDTSIYTGELQVSTDRKTITIPTTNLGLANGQHYYLKVKIDASSIVTLFDTDTDLTDLNADLVATDTSGTLIYFATPQPPAGTTSAVSGINTLTSTVFSGNGDTISYNSTYGPLVVGTTYYIQFGTGKLVTSITSTVVTYNSSDSDVQFRIAKVNDYVLSVTPVAVSTWVPGDSDKYGVSFSIGSLPDTNTINVINGGTLTISGLTVQR